MKFQRGDGTVLLPDDKVTYTVAFAADGNVNVFVRSYTREGGHLFLSLMVDGGSYEFEPMR